MVERDNVHIALAKNELLAAKAFCIIERKEIFTLFERRSIGGVEILRLTVIHNSATESNDIAQSVNNGKDDAIAEIVISSARFLAFAAEKACDAVELMVGGDIDRAMSSFNS